MRTNKFLVAAVIGAFTLPITVSAEDAKPSAPAIPTLSQVLDSSGITLSGYIDTAYSHANRDIENGFSDRVFDSQNNSFVLHQVGLTIAKQPKEGFGGLVNLTAGRDAGLIHSFDTTSETQFDVTQAFGQYAKGPLTLIAGKFVTLQGTEVIASSGNTNFSRSILFGAIPFTHTGVRATYALSDILSFTAGVNNGWDQVKDANKGKTLELGVTFTPIKPLTIAVSDYIGKEPLGATTDGRRNSFDIVATYAVIDPLTLGVEYVNVSQQKFTSLVDGSTIKAKYSGVAGYVTYMITPKWRTVIRAEWFKDEDGAHFGTPNTKYKEGTLTVGYLASDSFEVRGELRGDRADNAAFSDFNGSPSKSLVTYALQGIYKF